MQTGTPSTIYVSTWWKLLNCLIGAWTTGRQATMGSSQRIYGVWWAMKYSLMSVWNSWVKTKRSPSSSSTDTHTLSFFFFFFGGLIGVLARCGLSPGPENTGIAALRETFTTILKVGNSCSDGKECKVGKIWSINACFLIDEFPLQIIAAKCLIMISRDTPVNLKPVVLWHSQLKSSFAEKLSVEMDEGVKRLRPLLMWIVHNKKHMIL